MLTNDDRSGRNFCWSCLIRGAGSGTCLASGSGVEFTAKAVSAARGRADCRLRGLRSLETAANRQSTFERTKAASRLRVDLGLLNSTSLRNLTRKVTRTKLSEKQIKISYLAALLLSIFALKKIFNLQRSNRRTSRLCRRRRGGGRARSLLRRSRSRELPTTMPECRSRLPCSRRRSHDRSSPK